MNEEVQLVYEMTKERMEKAIEHLDNELMRIRAGKANVHILDGIMVDKYVLVNDSLYNSIRLMRKHVKNLIKK
jgi:ribosome recycling factor